MADAFKITNVTACTPGGLVEGAAIVVEAGRIVSVGADAPGPPACPERSRREVDGRGCYALPGFIDIHCHGAGLFELADGVFDPETGEFDTSDESIRQGIPRYVRLKGREGVSNFYMATGAAPKDQLRRAFRHLADYMAGDTNGVEGPLVKGALLEGTFYAPEMAGGLDDRFAFEPARSTFDALNESGVIRLANVVPDFGERACELIEYLCGTGVVPGAGHTDATADQFREAVRRGLRYVIHFTNGPTGGSYKPFDGGGVIEATLQLDEVYAELICDGYHVNPAYMRDIIARKGRDKIIAVTDQVFCTGTEVRTFRCGELDGEVAPDGSHVRVLNKKNTLFGSCLTMDAGFSNLLSYLTREMPGVWNRVHEAVPLEDALSAASRMCSANPARMIGLYDDPDQATGALEPGKWADIVLGTLDGGPGDYRFGVDKLFVRGRPVELG